MGFIGIFLISINDVFAETQNITVAARSYEQIPIFLNVGDELRFAFGVAGGSNDDINLIVSFPDRDDISGMVYENHSDSFIATSTGTYVFTFDNRFSLISNKAVSFSYQRIQNTFYVSVDELPQWANYAKNVVYESTKAWMDVNPEMHFGIAPASGPIDLRIKWVKDFGGEHIGYAYGDEFIEVGLGDSNCRGEWHPYSSDHVSHIMKHEIGHILGLDHDDDPDSIMYPTALNTEYGLVEEEFTLGKRYGQFIPLCSLKDLTSYSYNVSIDDPKYGFDVYFVPSKEEFDKWVEGEKFRYYSANDCYGEGFLTFNGECHGVTKESGLLVITNNILSQDIATVTIQQKEQPIPMGASLSPIDSKLNTGYHDHAYVSITMFGDQIDFSSIPFQRKDNYIQFEDGDGITVHRYNPSVSFVDLFKTIGMKLTNSCIVLTDGRQFCNNEDYSLNFYLNGKLKPSITNYIFRDGDVLDIIYIEEIKPIPKTAQSSPSKSSIGPTQQSSPIQESTVRCGEGTVLKDGQCVPERATMTTEMQQKSSNGGGCLIATATFGSELSPQVQMLREIRDNSLLQTQSGQSFMQGFNEFYYSFSPTIADMERQNPLFKEAVKLTITPLLASLSILNYVDLDSEESVLGYGVGIIMLNVGIYFVVPVLVVNRLINRKYS